MLKGLNEEVYIFDCEVFAHDWLFVFKNKTTKDYYIFHNDNEGVAAFMERDPLLAGFNNKHYDSYILKAVLCNFSPEEIKEVNDFIIAKGFEGWQHPVLSNIYSKPIKQYDLMDDCQQGLSLKAIEAHLGISIEETQVDFNIDRPLTDEELVYTMYYCRYDVDATDKLDDLRESYLSNKLNIGREIGIEPHRALYMTNAGITAAMLKAVPKSRTDERDYKYPSNLLTEYIPQEVIDFFGKLQDKSIPDEEVFGTQLEISIGECNVVIGYGGIHGAIPFYVRRHDPQDGILLRNFDVGSYYPSLMIQNGYASRNIPSFELFKEIYTRRMTAKAAGDKVTANALKLVLNTCYGAMLNKYNKLYDPLMGRSVCISGQLYLLELAMRLYTTIKGLRVVSLNTDGILLEYHSTYQDEVMNIINEWQERTHFSLEEDKIATLIQSNVNNYIEVAEDGGMKCKGGILVRGIAPAGAFNINNNANVIARAITDYLAYNVPIEHTVNSCENILDFQYIAKAGSLYSEAYQEIDGELVRTQKVNRVYAIKDKSYGTLFKKHSKTQSLAKIASLPDHCIVDNNNDIKTLDIIDKEWYIKEATRKAKEFLGIKPPKVNRRELNSLKRKMLKILKEDKLNGKKRK